MSQTQPTITYRRWDNTLFELTLTMKANHTKETIYDITSCKDVARPDYRVLMDSLSYNNVIFSTLDGERVITLQAPESKPINISCDSFYCKVEKYCNSNMSSLTLEVNSVQEYIDIIDVYRFVALLIKVEQTLVCYKEQCYMNTDNLVQREMASRHWLEIWAYLLTSARDYRRSLLNVTPEDLIQKKKICYTEMEDLFLNIAASAVHHAKKAGDHIEDDDSSNNANDKAIDNYKERKAIFDTAKHIERIMSTYKGNESNMYYRGVGCIIYPEQPGIFRNNKRFEEDRLYRAMKMSFPDELDRLRYLDRLAMLEHYELPTRMLDVTSNPLVALYMACNTIYSQDKNQEDPGEVILYFTGNKKERAYDSKSLLIVAALVKLSYSEKSNMYKFIRIHEVYLKKYDRKPDVKYHLKNILNRCIHLACDLNWNSSLPQSEKETLTKWCKDAQITLSGSEQTPFDYCYACMQDIKLPNGSTNWRCYNVDEEIHFGQQITKEHYQQLFSEFVASYERLLVTVRRENPAFENKIDIMGLLESVHGDFGMTNDRILAQSGSFIIAGLDHWYINEKMHSTRNPGYIRIIISDKKKITQELNLLNITDATMLPDMTHRAHYLIKQIKTI